MKISFPYDVEINTPQEAIVYVMNQCRDCPEYSRDVGCSGKQPKKCLGVLAEVSDMFTQRKNMPKASSKYISPHNSAEKTVDTVEEELKEKIGMVENKCVDMVDAKDDAGNSYVLEADNVVKVSLMRIEKMMTIISEEMSAVIRHSLVEDDGLFDIVTDMMNGVSAKETYVALQEGGYIR